MICEGLLPSHIRPGTSPSSDNSPADAHTAGIYALTRTISLSFHLVTVLFH